MSITDGETLVAEALDCVRTKRAGLLTLKPLTLKAIQGIAVPRFSSRYMTTENLTTKIV